MSDVVEKTIGTCKHCGKRVRVSITTAQWTCPQCECLNDNPDYIPDVDPVDSTPQDYNVYEPNRNRYSDSNIHSRSSAHSLAWAGFTLSIITLIMVFFINSPLLLIILAGISLTLSIIDALSTHESHACGTIGGVIAVVCIAIGIVAWVNNYIALQEMNTYYENFNDTLNNLGKTYP